MKSDFWHPGCNQTPPPDYPLSALFVGEKAARIAQIHTVGACSAKKSINFFGTSSSFWMAWIAKRQKASKLNSAIQSVTRAG
jgi:hypothetical protein